MAETKLQVIASRLAVKYSEIGRNDEILEDILTDEEKGKAVEFAVESLKNHFIWVRVHELGEPIGSVEAKVSAIDWKARVDEKEVLEVANRNKHRLVWEKEQRFLEAEAKRVQREELAAKCDAKYMFTVMKVASKYFGSELIMHEFNQDWIKALCFFTSRDPRFETELKYNFQKGIWVRGEPGRGKTYCVECLQYNELNPILIQSMIEITEAIKRDGDYILPEFKMLYLDDVGTEELDSKTFGSKITFFKNFIELEYLKNQKKDFSNLIISCNDSFDTIERKYGFRVRNRIKQMFNIVDIPEEAPDLRDDEVKKSYAKK
jgi:hypothetical protein